MQHLESIHCKPIIKRRNAGPDLAKCAALLADVYKSSYSVDEHDAKRPFNDIPRFTVSEISKAMEGMSKGKSADRNGILLEMFLHADEQLQSYLTYMFNHILESGDIPEDWRKSFFVLLHKGGDISDPNNWRSIAILNISYRIFAKVIFNRLCATLEAEQSNEQFGFQWGRTTADALIIAEQSSLGI